MKNPGFYLPKRLYLGEELLFRIEKYEDNSRIAILIETKEHEAYAVLTVNFPQEHLEEGEFCIKSWSENEGLVKACYDSGLVSGMFEDTGKRTVVMNSPIWRFSPEIAEYVKMKQEVVS